MLESFFHGKKDKYANQPLDGVFLMATERGKYLLESASMLAGVRATAMCCRSTEVSSSRPWMELSCCEQYVAGWKMNSITDE